jgi:hypothetical protein
MNFKTASLTLIVLVALGAGLASSALASPLTKQSHWEIGTTSLSTAQPIKCAKRGTENLKLKGTILGAETELTATGVECRESTISNTTVSGETMAVDAGRLRFTGVKVVQPPSCKTSETLETEPLSTRLDADSSASGVVYDKFEPTVAAGQFFSVKIEGCAIGGTYPLKGYFYGRAANPTGTLAANQPLIFDATTNGFGALTFGGKPVTITGELNNELASGEAFRATEVPTPVTPVTKKSHWEVGEFPIPTPAPLKCSKRGTEDLVVSGQILGAETELTASGVECKESTISNTTVASETMAVDAGKLRLIGVKIVKPTGCSVSETLETEPLVTKLEMSSAGGGATYDRFEPATSGGNIVAVKITDCLIAGTYPLKGNFYGQAVNSTGVLAANQPLAFNSAVKGLGSLTFGGKPATITGEINNELTSGAAYRATEANVVATPVTKKSQWEIGSTPITFPQQIFCSKRGAGNIVVLTSFFGSELELTASGVECRESTISNTTVAGEPMAVDTGRLRLTGLKIVKPTSCKVAETLETEPLVTKLEGDSAGGGIAYDKFEPAMGASGSFFFLKLTGCAVEGTYPFKGYFYGLAANPTGTLATNQPLLFNATTNGIGGFTFGGKPVTITGELNNELASGAEFRATEK